MSNGDFEDPDPIGDERREAMRWAMEALPWSVRIGAALSGFLLLGIILEATNAPGWLLYVAVCLMIAAAFALPIAVWRARRRARSKR